MVVGRKLRRKLVKDARRVTAPGEQDDRPPGTAPIQHFQSNVLVDADQSHAVRRWVLPRAGTLRMNQRRVPAAQNQPRRRESHTLVPFNAPRTAVFIMFS